MFGIDLWDASIAPALMVAGVAGLLSFLSPCVLPIVPPYLAYMAGASLNDLEAGRDADRLVLRTAVFFVLGLSTVFLLLGMAASSLGRVLLAYQYQMTLVSGAVIVVFGLHFLGVFRIGMLNREARIDAGVSGRSPLGAYVLGLAFAFGWTPCISPVLGSILSLAAQDGSVERGMLMMGFYAVGLGVPFLLTALFLRQAIGLMASMKRHMRLIERSTGVLLLAVGVLMLTGAFTAMSFWLLDTFPALALIG
ncbi:MAG: cytochrome c biogenesis protein CcdA [Rhodobacteraceae bacterium]|nr:cytochrome c biogenesis protein CcdA [Paracoccaceae bacterium]